MTATQLDRAAVAAWYGMSDPASVSKAVVRGSLPPPDGFVGRSPWWWSTTLDGWQRPGRGRRKKWEPADATPDHRQDGA